MREKAEKEGTATYDRRWRPEAGKTLPDTTWALPTLSAATTM
ncbi:Uncharacterised protein [Mycobacteroides abscessus subsp. massiliense]|nr:Uncharacterised protein [Mycobacteroides abscessus subsp. massiliense]